MFTLLDETSPSNDDPLTPNPDILTSSFEHAFVQVGHLQRDPVLELFNSGRSGLENLLFQNHPDTKVKGVHVRGPCRPIKPIDGAHGQHPVVELPVQVLHGPDRAVNRSPIYV